MVVRLGEELGKPVCATGDVHFLDPEDEIYRHVLLDSKGFADADAPTPLYFRTTEEMLEEFSYLGKKKAYEVVVTNTNLVASWCEEVKPLPDGLFAPKLENSAEELYSLVWGKAHELYGEDPPQIVKDRIELELPGIIERQVRRHLHVRPEAGAELPGAWLSGRLPWFCRLVHRGVHVGHHGGQLPAAPLPLPQVQARGF